MCLVLLFVLIIFLDELLPLVLIEISTIKMHCQFLMKDECLLKLEKVVCFVTCTMTFHLTFHCAAALC